MRFPRCLALFAVGLVAASAAETFKVKFEIGNLEGDKGKTGNFVVEVHPEWCPLGAARFREIIEENVWDKARFFRVVKGFVAQFGIPGKPTLAEKWRKKKIQDDPMKDGISNKRGYMVFAKSGEHTRTTQVFINFNDNANLDSMGFPPFGQIIEGMDSVVDKIYDGDGEKPNQEKVQGGGTQYLKEAFPKLSFVKSAKICSQGGEVVGQGEVPLGDCTGGQVFVKEGPGDEL